MASNEQIALKAQLKMCEQISRDWQPLDDDCRGKRREKRRRARRKMGVSGASIKRVYEAAIRKRAAKGV